MAIKAFVSKEQIVIDKEMKSITTFFNAATTNWLMMVIMCGASRIKLIETMGKST